MKKLAKMLSQTIALALVAAPFAAAGKDCITDVIVIGGNEAETSALKEAYQNQGWTVFDQDLNAGAGGDYIYLLAKIADSASVSNGFVTGFHIATDDAANEDELMVDGYVFHRAPYYGGAHFMSRKGDLNSNAGGDTIRLYYTKAPSPYYNSVIANIFFDNDPVGALGANGDSSGYDLNANCNATKHIYMHFTTTSLSYVPGVDYLDPTDPENPEKVRYGCTLMSSQAEISNGWYVVSGAVTNAWRIMVSGDVNLILVDGAELVVNGGVNVGEGDSLTIWAQSASPVAGKLTARGNSCQAGIGGGGRGAGGMVTINGGTVEAHGGNYGAGIGGGSRGAGGEVTINGGTVEAHGGNYGAGIGGGDQGSGGTVTVNGGEMTAQGGRFAVGIGGGDRGSGGMVMVKPSAGMGIVVAAGANEGSASPVDGSPFNAETDVTSLVSGKEFVHTKVFPAYLDPTDPDRPIKVCEVYTLYTGQTELTNGWYMVDGKVNVGNISVKGDVNLLLMDGAEMSAGAGVNVGSGKSLTIWAQSANVRAGKLTADNSPLFAGIGVGSSSAVTINGGTVTANGGTNAAGIGGGSGGSCGMVTINGGTVTAHGGTCAAGIGGGNGGSGGTVVIRGGTVTALCGNQGMGIGGGMNGGSGTLTIGDGMRVGSVGQLWADFGGRVTYCQTRNQSVRIEVCNPHHYDKKGICVRCGASVAASTFVAEFDKAEYEVDEGGTLSVAVTGGHANMPSRAAVHLQYLTAAAADLDLKNGTVDGVTPKGGLKFPLTLTWDAGDMEPKTISIPVKEDKTVEGYETFSLQLAELVGMGLGDREIAQVTISDKDDKQLKPSVSPYKPKNGETVATNTIEVSASPSDLGFAAGSGNYTAGTKLTMVAEARPGCTFVGWEKGGEIVSDKAKYQIVVSDDCSYTARFAGTDYITALACPADGGKATGSGYCPAGKKVTLKATANRGFAFLGWVAASTGETPVVPVATTASLVIDRTAKPAKDSKTSTTLANITSSATFYAVFEPDPLVSAIPVLDGDDVSHVNYDAGKVTGEGRYAPGRKVTLKATANKGFAFSGFCDAAGYLLDETRSASYSFEMPSSNVPMTARFVTVEADRGSIAAGLNGGWLPKPTEGEPVSLETNVTAGVHLEWPIAADALSQTTVKVSGLPSGLKFTAKDILKKGSKTEVEIPANTIYGAPTAASKTDKNGVKPSDVKITVTTAGKSSVTYLVKLTVDELPAWAFGVYNGTVEGGGIVQALTIAASGKISGKILEGGRTWALSAGEFKFSRVEDVEKGAVFYATVIGKAGKEIVTNEVTVTADGGVGVVSGFVATETPRTWTAWQNLWKCADTKASQPVFKKNIVLEYYPLVVPDDKNNTVKIAFRKDGAVSFSGKIGGVSVSGSAQVVLVGRDGDDAPLCLVTFYAPPKPKAKPPFAGWCETFPVDLTLDEQNIVTKVALVGAGRAKVRLWKGGPYWATTNVGAEEPEDYGYHFWWGDTIGYKWENEQWVASDGSVSGFSFNANNAQIQTFGMGAATLQSEGWITAGGVLAPGHDAAQAHWGGNWRMPTDEELQCLVDKCDWIRTTMNGVDGYEVRGRGDYASASIFLPSAGFADGTSLYYAGSSGYFWSSTQSLDYSWYSRCLFFYSGGRGTDRNNRPAGLSVRPVRDAE